MLPAGASRLILFGVRPSRDIAPCEASCFNQWRTRVLWSISLFVHFHDSGFRETDGNRYSHENLRNSYDRQPVPGNRLCPAETFKPNEFPQKAILFVATIHIWLLTFLQFRARLCGLTSPVPAPVRAIPPPTRRISSVPGTRPLSFPCSRSRRRTRSPAELSFGGELRKH